MIHVLFFEYEGKRHLRILDRRDDGQFMLDHDGEWILAAGPADKAGVFTIPEKCDFVETKDFVAQSFDDPKHAEFVPK